MPPGWLLCDGRAVSRTTYARLWAAIIDWWGAGDGSTTFNLPDLRRHVRMGSGGQASSVIGTTVGSRGGAETHTLTAAEMPAHTHGDGTLSASSAGSHTHGDGTLATASAGRHTHQIHTVGSEHVTPSGWVLDELRAARGNATPGVERSGAHTHDVTGATSSAGSHTHDVTGRTGSVGGGAAHSILQPSAIVHSIIRY